MMNSSALHSALKSAMQSYLDAKKKVQTIPGSNLKPEDGNVVPDSDLTTENLGLGDGGKVMDLDPVKAEADMIDAFAKAIAEEIIKHIKGYMELNVPAMASATLPSMTPLNGVGGGVVGPVQVFPQPISVQGGTITIPQAPSPETSYFK
jgi:hypothetical protein